MPLRQYQLEAKDSTIVGFEDANKQLVVIPTGGGKTILFAYLAQHYQPARTLILAHREELLEQARNKILQATGIRAEIEKADQRASMDAPIVVASVQTLAREKRRGRWSPDHFGLVVVDEAHHVLAESYRAVLAHFDGHAKVLGVTATPDRGDKKNLGQYFERVAYEVSLPKLIRDGFLSRIVAKLLPIKIDLRGVKKLAGDLSADDVGDRIEPWLRKVAEEMVEQCWDRKTIIFLPLVKTAERMSRILNEVGIESRAVSGYDDNRGDTMKWFDKEAGRGSALCNSMLLTEGFDQPDVDCIVNLRPTQMRSLYAQMVGRGTRLSPKTGKTDLLLLDFLWQTEKMSLVSAASLYTSDDEVAKAVTEKMVADVMGGGDSEEVDVEKAAKDMEEQRMKKVVESLKENHKRPAGTHDALAMCLSLGALDLMDFMPINAREAREMTAGQRGALERAGFDPATVTCFGHASVILDRLSVRRMEGLATPKQVRMMKNLRHPSPDTESFDGAKVWLDAAMSSRRAAA